jgi:NitT/TauT family transport system substrate-binding protein
MLCPSIPRRVLTVFVALLSFPLFFLALPAQAPAADNVVVGALPLSSSAPIFIAAEEGYFKQENLNVDVQLSRAAAAIAVGVAAGDYDVGATAVTAALFNIVMGEARLEIVADKGQLAPGFQFESIVVSKKMHDGGARRLKDLKGKSFGMTTLGSSFHYMLGNLAARDGMSLSDFQLKPLRGLPNMVGALASGQVDFAIFPEPTGTQAQEKGGGVVIGWVDETLPYQIAVIFYGGKIADNKDVGTRFMKAYIRGTRYYHDHMLRGKEDSAEFKKGAEHIAKYTKQALTTRRGLIFMDRNGKLMAEDIGKQVDWYAANGFVPATTKEALPKMVNTSFQEAAVKQLGP